MAFPVPLELWGQLVGLELIAIAILLTFRHKYVDGFQYPWQIPFVFFLVGSATVIIVSRVSVVGVIKDIEITFLGYLLLGVAGLLAAHYFWWIYPDSHPDPNRLSDTPHDR